MYRLGYAAPMELRSVPIAEWRQMSEAEQRAIIRDGMADYETLPESIRPEVEEMLATGRPIPSRT